MDEETPPPHHNNHHPTIPPSSPDMGRTRLRNFRIAFFLTGIGSIIAASVTAFVILKKSTHGNSNQQNGTGDGDDIVNTMAMGAMGDAVGGTGGGDDSGGEVALPMIGSSNDFSPDDNNNYIITNQYEVLERVDHDKTSFTQGLSYGSDGYLYETTGLNGKSKIRQINPKTFQVELSRDIPSQYFGEGSTFYTDKDGNDRIIHITWKSQTGFIYDAKTLTQLQQFTYTTTPETNNQGWGITYDESNQEFIVSDGSPYLYFWDRDTLEMKRRVTVTRMDGTTEQDELNELEFIDGLVCCNIWYSDEIICVDPVTGKAVKEIDFSDLWPLEERRNAGADVLNGIANGGDHVLITGKLWDRMYKVKLLV